MKAAMAHLMTGDVAGADTLAQQYFDARAKAKDPTRRRTQGAVGLDYRAAAKTPCGRWSNWSAQPEPAPSQSGGRTSFGRVGDVDPPHRKSAGRI
ncbi:MAG: hypothetical protein WDO73_11725 [Ignavibacteriota bacterium]